MPRRNDRARHRTDVKPPFDPDFDHPGEADGTSPLPLRRDPDTAHHLENLRVALQHANAELYARLERPIGRPPQLRVTNPGARHAVENISIRAGAAACDPDHYVWAWDQPIGPVTDPERAATSVLRVLEVRGRRM